MFIEASSPPAEPTDRKRDGRGGLLPGIGNGVLRDPQFVSAEPFSTTGNAWLLNLFANLFVSSVGNTQIVVMRREIHH
jgi:hypothetical protein